MYKMLFFLLIIGLGISYFKVDFSQDIRTTEQKSAQLAPHPDKERLPIVQVYEAREYKWKGLITTHSWIAVKPSFAREYTVYQINRFLAPQNKGSVLEIKQGVPDQFWFGNKPKVICEVKGQKAASVIRKIKQIAQFYPYKTKYEFFPGPNANTFTSYVLNECNELQGDLSPLALGKDYHESTLSFERTPSDTGYKISFKGVCTVQIAKEEGVCVSFGGLTFGYNANQKEIYLPLVGVINL